METRQKTAIITLLAMFGIALVGNIVLTLYYLKAMSPGPTFDYFLALGLLIAQPCLFSIWCALGGQKAILRIPASMGMLTVLSIVYISLLIGDGAPAEVVLVLGGCVIAITTLIQIPLWIFRASTKQAVALPTQAESKIGTSQFGIKHLLISTTIAAIVVAVAQANAQHLNFNPSVGVPWFSLILFLAFFIIVASVLTFLILAVVFNRNHRLVFVVFLAIILIAAPLASLELFRSLPGLFGTGGGRIQWNAYEVVNAFCFIFSLASGIMGVLFIFYAIGFRLKKYSV